MGLTMDPQVQQALSRIRAIMGSTERPPRGDWKTRRKHGEAMFAASAKSNDREPRSLVTRATSPSHESSWARCRGSDVRPPMNVDCLAPRVGPVESDALCLKSQRSSDKGRAWCVPTARALGCGE